jgi:hypothetical protein
VSGFTAPNTSIQLFNAYILRLVLVCVCFILPCVPVFTSGFPAIFYVLFSLVVMCPSLKKQLAECFICVFTLKGGEKLPCELSNKHILNRLFC